MSELIKKATRQLSSTGILGSVQRMASLIRSLESLGCMVEHRISQGAEYVRARHRRVQSPFSAENVRMPAKIKVSDANSGGLWPSEGQGQKKRQKGQQLYAVGHQCTDSHDALFQFNLSSGGHSRGHYCKFVHTKGTLEGT